VRETDAKNRRDRRVTSRIGTVALLLAVSASACDSDPTGPVIDPTLALSTGNSHTCVIDSEAGTFCWGPNGAGQIGDGTGRNQSFPAPVFGEHVFRLVTAGGSHTCGISEDDRLFCWGDNSAGALGEPAASYEIAPLEITTTPLFTTIAAGAAHTCGIDGDGTPFCWGSNGSGQLGSLETTAQCGNTPCSDLPIPVAGNLTLESLAAGNSHTCGITPDGAVYCWGTNGSGQLGNGFMTRAAQPVLVKGDIGFTQVSAGTWHTCALTEMGTLYCWGSNDEGQLGVENPNDRCGSLEYPCSTKPDSVETALRFRSVTAGGGHTCAIAEDGRAYCWGDNWTGQLGDGTTSPSQVPRPVAVLGTVLAIEAGQNHTCATDNLGNVYCWGDNLIHQLGNGGVGLRRLEPTLVPIPPDP